MSIRDFAPRPQGSLFESAEFQRWIDSLGDRQNIDMQNELTSLATGDEFYVLDISETSSFKTKKITAANILAGLIEEGPWTPTDISGASLALTSVGGWYQKVRNWVHFTGGFTYPVTASGATAAIGGLPYTVKNSAYARSGNLVQHNGAFATKCVLAPNFAGMNFTDTFSTANATNLQMSETISYVSGSYRVEP